MNELREYVKRKFNLSDDDYNNLVEKEKVRINTPTFDYTGSLEDAIKEKIRELSYMCKQSIMYGFVASNGNGYRLTVEDQLNLQGQKSALDDDSTITSVDWLTIDDNSVTHTRDEWLTVYKEAFAHKDNAIWKNKNLREQVKTSTTISEVESVVW